MPVSSRKIAYAVAVAAVGWVAARPVAVLAAGPTATAGASADNQVVLKVGDRTITKKQLAEQLAFEPAPILDRIHENQNFASFYAIHWYEAELFAKAASDDGVTAKIPGLEGAAHNLSRNLIADEYIRYVLNVDYKPTDAEVKTYYTMNKDACKTPARYHFARTGVQVAKNASDEEQAGAKKRLDAMQARLKAGDAFGTVADELSDLPAKAAGGDVGWISDEELGKEEGVGELRRLQVGAYSEPLKTRRGLEIFKLIEKQDAKDKTIEECREQIVKLIDSDYRKAATRKRTDELAKRYDASLNLDEFVAAARGVSGVAETPPPEGSGGPAFP